ncbi:MAG: hypothetical protein H0W78_17380 [Planctomycetes bacterium]|nr:hypothetical protein [Planctomycetota bacterium]
MHSEPGQPEPTPTPSTANAAKKRRPFLLVVLSLLSAVILYVASAGPLLYLAFRLTPDPAADARYVHFYYIIYRPHLDLCYRSEAYYRYLFWFGAQAGRTIEPHNTFKRDYQRYLRQH